MQDQSPPSSGQHQQKYAKAIQAARDTSEQAFHAWFDASSSLDESVTSGFWDFSVHILTPQVLQYIASPHQKTALEIGHGGGRLLNVACNYFGKSIGIDIHDQNDYVAEFLKGQGKDNFELIKTNGTEIEVAGTSIDLVYSFIVLQHLPSYQALEGYIAAVSRILKPGGVAQLYFGKFGQLSFGEQLRYRLQGYKEITNAEVNHTSLVVHSGKMKSLCGRYGLRVVDFGISYKNVPSGYPGSPGNQNYVTAVRQ
ncbi:MAG: class I SAM-dependent methyltransferase [Chloroflexi bacterium]|nr:MAG: class I SAM-dependent methyltransferase [Chloroflexota bacterium]MBL1193076.1 class I SAM-dependent methyltransferase [Chloroflexota bacterium]NOH10369.1 class I SAM-dependent methyltransferase [Chloroflexota bacterium]